MPSRCVLSLLFAGWGNESGELRTGGWGHADSQYTSQKPAPAMARNFPSPGPLQDGCLGLCGQSTPEAALGREHRRSAGVPELTFAPSFPGIRRPAPGRLSATRRAHARVPGLTPRACVVGLGRWVQGQGRGWGGLFAGGWPSGVSGTGRAPRPLLRVDLRRPALGVGVTLQGRRGAGVAAFPGAVEPAHPAGSQELVQGRGAGHAPTPRVQQLAFPWGPVDSAAGTRPL